MKFFINCSTIEDVKGLYKKLALENHPDRGGDTSTMQAINAEYAYACAYVLKRGGFTDSETDSHIRMSEEYREVIEEIINLPDIIIEVVGHWIWVTGNTYPLRKELKSAGLYFASKKLAWYYRSDEFKTKGGKKTLDEIRNKYGSERVAGNFKRVLKYK
jgi:hypothetical protein